MIASGGGLLIRGIFLLGAILAGYAIWYLLIKKWGRGVRTPG